MIEAALAEGVVSRGIANGVLDVKVHDLRDHTTDRHRSVDDVPYGGGPGMVMKPEPLVKAVEEIRSRRGTPEAVILLSPQGERFTQAEAARLSQLSHIGLLCGRYEGMDERVPELVGAREISLAAAHHTRPAEFAGLKVPDVLLSGHHADVRRWRKKTALARTLERRPDLIERASLDEEDRALLDEIVKERKR